MTLYNGDLTTLNHVKTWIPAVATTASDLILTQLIQRMSQSIYTHLNRSRLYSQPFVRYFNGQGNNQIMLPDWPVTAISAVQVGQYLVPQSNLPVPNQPVTPPDNPGYGWTGVLWAGNLPGDPTVVEFRNGGFWWGQQNVKISYTAGYLIANETGTIPITPGPYTIQVAQPQGTWCRDNGVTYTDGTSLSPVTTLTGAGQYIIPTDSNPGLYTFDSADQGRGVLISYSFIPADLEEACIQLIAERYSYRTRVGEISKSLGGQETMTYMRGGRPRQQWPGLPPEVEDIIWRYVSVISPAIGANT